MKFNAVAAAVSAAMLAGVAHAEDVVEESSVAPELPTFTVGQSPPAADRHVVTSGFKSH